MEPSHEAPTHYPKTAVLSNCLDLAWNIIFD